MKLRSLRAKKTTLTYKTRFIVNASVYNFTVVEVAGIKLKLECMHYCVSFLEEIIFTIYYVDLEYYIQILIA